MPEAKRKPVRNRRGASSAPPAPEKTMYATADEDGDVLDIPLEDIAPNPFNDRDMGDLSDLALSIGKEKVLQSITVMHAELFAAKYPDEAHRVDGKKYVIGFGERRWRASKIAAQRTISCVLRNDLVPTIRRIIIAENLHRKNPTPIEEARSFLRYQRENLSYRQIADEVGCSLAHVSRRLALLNLPDQLQSAISAGDLGVKDAGQLAELEDPELQTTALELMRGGMHVVEAKARVTAQPPAQRSVPQGNAEDEPGQDEPPVPQGNTSAEPDQGERSVPQGNAEDEPDHDQPPVPQGNTSAEPAKPTKTGSKPVPKVDGWARARSIAAADRNEACKELLQQYDAKAIDSTVARVIANALLTPMQQSAAQARAHSWLRETGHGPEVGSVAGYFEAVLSSDSPELITLAAFATALAAAELRAADRRRPAWDSRDIAHVKLLTELAGYVPENEWEKQLLVPRGNTSA